MIENKNNKKGTTTKVDQKLTDDLKWLPDFLEVIGQHFDPNWLTIDLVLTYDYLCFKPGVKHAYACPTASLNPEEEVPALSASEYTRLLDFLESGAQVRAVTYRRDGNGFVWCVTDEEAYRTCCEKFGYKDADFKACHQPETKE